jgi:hypothetical protein
MNNDDKIRAIVIANFNWRSGKGLTREDSVTWLKGQVRAQFPEFPRDNVEATEEFRRLGFHIRTVPHGVRPPRTYVSEVRG